MGWWQNDTKLLQWHGWKRNTLLTTRYIKRKNNPMVPLLLQHYTRNSRQPNRWISNEDLTTWSFNWWANMKATGETWEGRMWGVNRAKGNKYQDRNTFVPSRWGSKACGNKSGEAEGGGKRKGEVRWGGEETEGRETIEGHSKETKVGDNMRSRKTGKEKAVQLTRLR